MYSFYYEVLVLCTCTVHRRVHRRRRRILYFVYKKTNCRYL